MTAQLRMRDVASIGARFRHKTTGRAVQVVQSHRAERSAELAGELDARYLRSPRRQLVPFALLASEYELLVDLGGAR